MLKVFWLKLPADVWRLPKENLELQKPALFNKGKAK